MAAGTGAAERRARGARGESRASTLSQAQRAGLHDKASHPFRYSHMSRERPPARLLSRRLCLCITFSFLRACVCVPREQRRRGRARRIRNPIVLENTKSLSIQSAREREREREPEWCQLINIRYLKYHPRRAPAPVRALLLPLLYCASPGKLTTILSHAERLVACRTKNAPIMAH